MSKAHKVIDYGFKGLDTVVVPEIFFQTMLSEEDIDSTLSDMGGLVPSQVVLVSGNPGAGKTTLAAKVAARISKVLSRNKVKKKAAMISLEMSDFQLAAQAKKLDAEFIDITMGFSMDQTFKKLREMQPSCVILDSIQKAAHIVGGSQHQALKDIMSACVAFSKETFIPFFIICHADKGGNYKGPSDLEHDCDTHLRVYFDEELEIRTFWWVKNRFGGDPREKMFGIERDRVWIGDPYRLSKRFEPTETGAIENAPTAMEISTLWKKEQESGEWKSGNLHSLVKHTVEFLKTWEKDTLTIGDVKKVHLKFEGNKIADCTSGKGMLRFGKMCWDPAEMKMGKVGYRKEKQYIERWCSSSYDLLLWVVLHEWTHLYPAMGHHKHEFFRRVEKLAKDTGLFQAFGK